MKLRPYQEEAKAGIYRAWDNGYKNVLAVLPTGAGKTVLFSQIIKESKTQACAIAHRQELVGQISLALARNEVRHKIIGPISIVKFCVNLHMSEVGSCYYDPNSDVAVAGIDSLIRRRKDLGNWLNSVKLWVQDEAHHVLKKNKWGAAVKMFPNAKGLGVTATPLRADGHGLGGVFDHLYVGPSMRHLINEGYLSDYIIFAPPPNIDTTNAIIGNVVSHYLRIAKGKLGITFATDVAEATNIAAAYNAKNVPTEVVSAKTSDAERISIIRRFKNKELLQLVNVDLFGEGFDLPAIEVVSMARFTDSYALYAQQFGRALRILEGKDKAFIIDHVGNVIRHGLPDAGREWTLDSSSDKSNSDGIPVKACAKCTGVYERINSRCPYCDYKAPPSRRSTPEQVDGDLIELDYETLAAMRGQIAKVDKHADIYRAELVAKRAPRIGVLAHVKRHRERQEAQKLLRTALSLWGGYHRSLGRSDSESYRRFYFKFGVDVLSAQALNRKDSLDLTEKLNIYLKKAVDVDVDVNIGYSSS